jgi:RNA polymerase sigma factor (sigma-70 family)
LAKYRRLILAIRASSTVSLDTVAKPDDLPPQVSALPIQGEEAESIRRLRSAVANLPGREARVAMALCEGRSPREIASQLGVSESSVSLLKARAIRQLRVSLQITVVPHEADRRTFH